MEKANLSHSAGAWNAYGNYAGGEGSNAIAFEGGRCWMEHAKRTDQSANQGDSCEVFILYHDCPLKCNNTNCGPCQPTGDLRTKAIFQEKFLSCARRVVDLGASAEQA